MQEILSKETFDIDSDIQIQLTKKKDDALSPYTTINTLLALDFDTRDIVDELKRLTVEEYYETIIDDRTTDWNKFYVFGKIIQGKSVYIKVRIKCLAKDIVFCISFHFAEHPMTEFPYS